MAKKKLPSFTLQLPKLTTRKVWVGIYSEMTGTVVMVFDGKPEKDSVLDEYNVLSDKYIASVWIDEWEHWFGTVQPFIDANLIEDRGENIGYVVKGKSLECCKVIEIELTASWNEFNQIIGLNVNANN